MKLRILFILLISCIAGLVHNSGLGGLLESPGPKPGALFVHIAAPIFLGLLIVLFFRSILWKRQLLLALGCFLLAEAVRCIIRGFYTHWHDFHRLFTDSKIRFLLLASLGLQIAVGLLAFGAARLFIYKNEKGNSR